MNPVVICTSAFGAETVRRRGQAAMIEPIMAAGADGIEIREELLTDLDYPFTALQREIATHTLMCVYACTTPLFDARGELDITGLECGLARAEVLGAALVKFGLGGLSLQQSDLDNAAEALLKRAAASSTRITIENDQTERGGDPAGHEALFRALDHQQAILDVPPEHVPTMTLDLGNGRWSGHAVQDVVSRLGHRVGYVHCKAVVVNDTRLAACAPDESTLRQWSHYWNGFMPELPRAIEYPVAYDDTAELAHQVALLRNLPQQEINA